MKIVKTIPVPVGALWELLDAINHGGGVRLREMQATKSLAKSGLSLGGGESITNPLVDLETAFEREAKKLGVTERAHLFVEEDRMWVTIPFYDLSSVWTKGRAYTQCIWETRDQAYEATQRWRQPNDGMIAAGGMDVILAIDPAGITMEVPFEGLPGQHHLFEAIPSKAIDWSRIEVVQ